MPKLSTVVCPPRGRASLPPLGEAWSEQLYVDFGLTPEDVGAHETTGMSVLGLPYKVLVGAEH